jgi:hypothetical protein
MAVTVALRPLEVVGTLFTGGMGNYAHSVALEADSQVFARGELLQVDSSGDLIRVATANLVGGGDDKLDVSDITGSESARIFGVAMKAATNVTAGNIVIPAMAFLPGTVIEANLVDGSDGDAPTGHVHVAGDILDRVALVFDDTEDQWYLTTDAGEECATVLNSVGIANNAMSGGGLGDTNVRVTAVIDSRIGFLASVV